MGIISEDISHIALRIWLRAYELSEKRMAVPSACANSENGSLMYSWDTELHHLEIDIIPGVNVELFFMELKTRKFWSRDVCMKRMLAAEPEDKRGADILFTPNLLECLPLFHVDKGTNRRPEPGAVDGKV